MTFVVASELELFEKIFSEIEPIIAPGLKIGLVGDLGAGKTALTKEFGKYFIVEQDIISPTFNIAKSYLCNNEFREIKKLNHLDLYRFENAKRSDIEEFKEWLDDSEAMTVVEWPEMIDEIYKRMDVIVRIKIIDTNQREVELICK